MVGSSPLTDIKERTLVSVRVDKIVNLTKETMWIYGTSGELLELTPDELEFSNPADKTVSYIVDEESKKLLLQLNPKFANRMANAIYIGNSRDDRPVYRLESFHGGISIVPITERFGYAGKIYSTRLKKAVVG